MDILYFRGKREEEYDSKQLLILFVILSYLVMCDKVVTSFTSDLQAGRPEANIDEDGFIRSNKGGPPICFSLKRHRMLR
jgi:hypothetical protein